MTKAPIERQELRLELQDRRFDLQELRRRIYRKAKSEKTHRFWGLFVHVTKRTVLPKEIGARRVSMVRLLKPLKLPGYPNFWTRSGAI